MKRKRRTHKPEFKAKVALTAAEPEPCQSSTQGVSLRTEESVVL